MLMNVLSHSDHGKSRYCIVGYRTCLNFIEDCKLSTFLQNHRLDHIVCFFLLQLYVCLGSLILFGRTMWLGCHKQGWKCCKVSLKTPSAVASHMAGDGLTSCEKYLVLVTTNKDGNFPLVALKNSVGVTPKRRLELHILKPCHPLGNLVTS